MASNFFTALAGHFKAPEKLWATPYEAARHFDPKTVQTPALAAIDEFLMKAYTTPDFRGIISMPPQNGKSLRASIAFPAWVLQQDPDTRIVIASYESQIAIRFSDTLRRQIKDRGESAGLTIGGKDTERNWQIRGHRGGVYAASVGGALTSRSADLLIIDDPVKGFAEAASPTYQAKTWDWWTGTALTRVQGGGSVIVILTRWHDDDLAGQLMRANPGVWEFLRIPAQADHRPELGESDPLGREPGEYMKSVQGFTREQWEERKKQVGPKTWAALYQGTPSPDEGGIFPRDVWDYYEQKLTVTTPDQREMYPNYNIDTELIQSWDMAFKGEATSDFVVGQVWLRKGPDCYLLDQVRGRWTFTETLQQVKALSAKYPQAITKLIEDKANGPASIDMLRRAGLPGITPVNPQGGKTARANAVSPLVHAKNVHLPAPELAPWVGGLAEEAALFPASSHDDQVDALTQALTHLMVRIIDNKKATHGMVALD